MGRPPTAAHAIPSPYPPPTQQEAQTISNPPPPAQLYPPPPPPPQPQPPQPPEQYPPPNANVPMPPSPQKPPVVPSALPQVNVVAGVPATMPPANIPVAYPPPSPLPQAVPTTVPSTNVPVAYPPPSPLPQAAVYGVNTAVMNGANMGMNGSNFGTNGGGNVMSNNGAKAFFGTGTWTTGLFDCLDDPSNAIVTSLFPCITFGQIAEVLDEGHSTCGTSGTIYLCTFCHSSRRYRQKLRMKYGLIEAPISDKMAHCLFEWCALCQEYRELANRGLHPALGWQGNMNAGLQTQDNQFAMVPPMNQVMS